MNLGIPLRKPQGMVHRAHSKLMTFRCLRNLHPRRCCCRSTKDVRASLQLVKTLRFGQVGVQLNTLRWFPMRSTTRRVSLVRVTSWGRLLRGVPNCKDHMVFGGEFHGLSIGFFFDVPVCFMCEGCQPPVSMKKGASQKLWCSFFFSKTTTILGCPQNYSRGGKAELLLGIFAAP